MFYLQLCGVGHMVKNHLDSERGKFAATTWATLSDKLQVLFYMHDWCNKGCDMCYPVCGMLHIKEPLLLIGKSSPCGGSRFPLLPSEW